MRRHWFTGCLVLADAVTIVLAAFFSLYLRFDGQDLQQIIFYRQYERVLWQAMPVLLISYLGMLFVLHVYRYVWRYAERKEIFHIELAGLCATLLFVIYRGFCIIASPYKINTFQRIKKDFTPYFVNI